MRVPRDGELVQAALEGNSEAFDELAERYSGKLYNAALRVTGNPEDALDATQNALLKAYDNLASFDPSYRFFSWIYRIQLNEALNLVHKRRRYVGLPSEMPAPTQATPEREYLDRETGSAIETALLELTPDYRAVVVLRHFHGFSYEEMAEILSVPAKTVKSRLFTARRALRQKLSDKGIAGA